MLTELCEICEENSASKTCKICGRRVCEEDYVHSNGMCKVCEATICRICGIHLSIGYCVFCGRQVCEDCAVELDELRYACKECISAKSV